MTPSKINIAIDRGGTFTDCIGVSQGRDDIVIKLLSVNPDNYDDAPIEGIRKILEKHTGKRIGRDEMIQSELIESIRMGTTVATNALLERKGERCALFITKGFKDLLAIGNQSRPRIFDLAIHKPDVLYSQVIEVDERVTLENYSEDPNKDELEINKSDPAIFKGISGEPIRVLKVLDESAVKSDLKRLYHEGFRSIAVCLLHSYTFSDHEDKIRKLAEEIGYRHISLSSKLMPMIKIVPRGTSSTADSYLSPVVRQYLSGFSNGFRGRLGGEAAREHNGPRCEFMQSDGGLVDIERFSGLKAILSGPAGGVVGYARTSYDADTKVPVIGFDMGGTSTDVSRYAGSLEHVFETTTAGVTIQSPQLDINTVAAGGGSLLHWMNGLFVVGPDSAGAHPGPACYRKGGQLTVTDANLFLGRLVPEFFPKIFGPKENEPLDLEAPKKLLQEMCDLINQELGDNKLTLDETAYGFIKVANEAMARPIRALTEAKGYDVSKHRLATFGGAGGQHACAIAQSLGISQILVHRYSSVLSAYGMALADVVHEIQEPCAETWDKNSKESWITRMEELKKKTTENLRDQGFSENQIKHELYLNMRYQGTDTSLMIVKPEGGWSFGEAFVEQHEEEFGFTLHRNIIIDDIRVRGIGMAARITEESIDKQLKRNTFVNVDSAKAHTVSKVYFEGGRLDTPVYELEALSTRDEVAGPALIIDDNLTIIITPNANARILDTHVIINLGKDETAPISKSKLANTQLDPVMLSIFSHRFMSIAEQMGRTLQKTSISTNIKERLDYSCALFDSNGGLVANAPHLPVHLGSMSTCIVRQSEIWKGKLSPGDVLVTNHPDSGGTHLPDITVITPAFSGNEIIFYVASRAHHADIGGILPGSMPPTSKELFEEGAAIYSSKLVKKGKFDEEGVTNLLLHEPSKLPGCSGTRCLRDNISDLKAQVSANKRGIDLIKVLVEDYGEDVVQFYMRSIQKNAENAVRNLLKDVSMRFKGENLRATDYMDDGTPISLNITINGDMGEAVFDFEGTGNTNAPEAITYSAIIYCLRSLISDDIPLNQGCLLPIRVCIPKYSLLSPSSGAAVVGGNVLTSQRVTDVILKAFRACAASQGDCNNLTFGTDYFGYYETIAGGAGAGPSWDGQNGVHTHMTNTRITDPEILERRYPVILHQFAFREGSGGIGQHRGGNGLIREIEFRIPCQVSILSERRVHRPYGMNGGGDGQCGLNLWVRKGSDSKYKIVNLGGKNTARMTHGERIIVCTPGAGAWGFSSTTSQKEKQKDHTYAWLGKGSAISYQSAQESA
ncbi:hypothetical protein NEOLI_003786 [Neolecta irregularis DAH-3]|uniref:5-oxoprolinase n=1 Tax=Neolecta irregularis (strain DAH-3) TaxID=1198029 RepID=A0A1U7LS83_NEOID|nr:hypothetical protein NEOLI_003786 [Neolecta irregularis DAH-3]|eukprot:OLL25443.1 hypothetical protein NEOLI_003786 [Neolecta irregularis DAH-3]